MKLPVSKCTFSVLALGAALVGVLVGSSCSHVPPQIAEPAKIVADCSVKAVHDTAGNILDDVASALITTDYSGGLRNVATNVAGTLTGVATEKATEVGWQSIRCAITELLGQANVHLGYGGMDQETTEREMLLKRNAESWLASH